MNDWKSIKNRLVDSQAAFRAGADKLSKRAADSVRKTQTKVEVGEPKIAHTVTQGVEAIANGVEWLAKRGGKAAETRELGSGGSSISKPGIVSVAIDKASRGAEGVERALRRTSTGIGNGSAGMARGVGNSIAGCLDWVAIKEADLVSLRSKIDKYSGLERNRGSRHRSQITEAAKASRRKELEEHLVLAGVSLATILNDPERVPPDVEEAFSLAFPGLRAAGETFVDAVARMDTDSLVGFLSTVKGKLFEIKLVQDLNSQGLPDDQTARLAEATNQPGHDIEIVDSQGEIASLLQAKATDSATYVSDAFIRYPEIDVITTSEVFADLLARDAGSIANSGISDEALERAVKLAVEEPEHAFDAFNLIPGGVGIGLISLATILDPTVVEGQKAAEAGRRVGGVAVSGAVAQSVLVMTNLWWLGLVGGASAHWVVGRGKAKRDQYDHLRALAAILERRHTYHSS